MADLGVIERVDLREVWPDEAQDFTPWLAENLDKLGEALGLDLEFREREAPVGPFSLDVLAHDRDSDRPVIIENQLEPTDHDHLGKLLTYAAAYEAYAVVWLACDFRYEHYQALDWLNQRTDDDTAFFSVIVELWRIDDSRPAPHFRVVAMPEDWQKQTPNGAGPEIAEWEAYREFWQSLAEKLQEKASLIQVAKAGRTDRYNIPSGFDGVSYGASFSKRRKLAHVGVYIDRGKLRLNNELFDSLSGKSDEIQADLGNKVDWDRRDDRRGCRIREEKPGSIDGSHDNLEEIKDWMVDRLLTFKRVFEPHLAELTPRQPEV